MSDKRITEDGRIISEEKYQQEQSIKHGLSLASDFEKFTVPAAFLTFCFFMVKLDFDGWMWRVLGSAFMALLVYIYLIPGLMLTALVFVLWLIGKMGGFG